MAPERIQMVFIQLVPFLMAIVFHEVAHAFVARRYGDNTAEDLGRLTLNPIPHIHPIGTLLFPILNMLYQVPLIGWAKPVPINYNRLRPYRSGLFFVSLAGPAANVILALISAFVLVLLSVIAQRYLGDSQVEWVEPVRLMALAAISINYWLAFFNLIPIPPLDGSKLIEAFMSYNTVKKFEQFQMYGVMILLVLAMSGGLGLFVGPITFLSNFSISIWVALFAKLGFVV
jgi:Zn-dependent protease